VTPNLRTAIISLMQPTIKEFCLIQTSQERFVAQWMDTQSDKSYYDDIKEHLECRNIGGNDGIRHCTSILCQFQ